LEKPKFGSSQKSKKRLHPVHGSVSYSQPGRYRTGRTRTGAIEMRNVRHLTASRCTAPAPLFLYGARPAFWVAAALALLVAVVA
jgi:hypothetical protein